MEQEGRLLRNGTFAAFVATQEFRTRCNHAGFVWDVVARTKCGPFCGPDSTLPTNVCHAYIKGEGMVKAQLPLGIPATSVRSNTPELNRGKLMCWAAEATLFPLALIPRDDAIERGNKSTRSGEIKLQWLVSDEDVDESAVLQFKCRSAKTRLLFCLDPDSNSVASVQGTCSRLTGDQRIMTTRGCYFFDQKLHGGFRVPTRMEAAWQADGGEQPEIYFKGANRNFIHLTNRRTNHPCGVDRDHVE